MATGVPAIKAPDPKYKRPATFFLIRAKPDTIKTFYVLIMDASANLGSFTVNLKETWLMWRFLEVLEVLSVSIVCGCGA